MLRKVYSIPHSFNLVVNPGRAVPISPDRTGVEVVILVATIANLGIIYVGGQECNAQSGLELDGGRGVLFAATSSFGYQEAMASALGTGLRFNTMGAPRPEYGNVPALVPLNQIFVTASIAAQGLRVMYMLPVSM